MLYCCGVDNVVLGGGLLVDTDLGSSSVAIPTLIWSPNFHLRDTDTKYYDKVKCWGNKLDMQEDRLMCSDWKLPLFCDQKYVHATGYLMKSWYLYRGYDITVVVVTYLLTYLLTPWCRVLLEKLTGFQLVKKFPAFHGTRRFITALTSLRHLSLSWASPIQSIYPHPTSWRSVLILSTHLRLGLPSGRYSYSTY